MPPRRHNYALQSFTNGRPMIDGVEQFASKKVYDAYCGIFKIAPVHRARGLDLENCGDELLELVDRYGWRDVVAPPGDVNVDLVREFYSYLRVHNGRNVVMVRGKPVIIDSGTINYYLGLDVPDHENEYTATFDGSDTWLEAVGNYHQIAWTIGPEARTFQETNFVRWEDKCLHRLVRSNLFPAKHVSTVYYAHATLMYWLRMGLPVNVGALIRNEMNAVALKDRHTLPFGSLITTLCESAECPVLGIDAYVPPMPIISLTSVPAPEGHAHGPAEDEEPPEYDQYAQYPDPEDAEPLYLPSTSDAFPDQEPYYPNFPGNWD